MHSQLRLPLPGSKKKAKGMKMIVAKQV